MLQRPYLAGALLLITGLLRIYISSLNRLFLFSTLNIVAIALALLGAGLMVFGLGRVLVSLVRHLWTSLGG